MSRANSRFAGHHPMQGLAAHTQKRRNLAYRATAQRRQNRFGEEDPRGDRRAGDVSRLTEILFAHNNLLKIINRNAIQAKPSSVAAISSSTSSRFRVCSGAERRSRK